MSQENTSLLGKVIDGIIAATAIALTFWLLLTYAIPKQLLFNQEMGHRARLASVEANNE